MGTPSISGFTFVRNAITYDFPLRESLLSLMSVCDDVVVVVGRSDDATLELVRSLDDGRLTIVETVWDDSLREGGRVLAQQTDIALSHCRSDWSVYLQADEVLHEDDRERLRDAIHAAHNDSRIDALLVRYLHFYGSYDYLGTGRQWYRQEIRAVRNTGSVVSWGDAQGFRRRAHNDTFEKLRARRTDVRVFHYGWVKPPQVQMVKQRAANRLWHDDDWIAANLPDAEAFDYDSAYQLERYTGTHPAVMKGRVEDSRAWSRAFDPTRLRRKSLAMRITDAIEAMTGWRVAEYRNFIEV
ncbi:MAG: glycosyltransferase family 2 protein [bacterium]|nr:glycosyltransferase family 2 protein [Candidatus Kapabacteria bacterium]